MLCDPVGQSAIHRPKTEIRIVGDEWNGRYTHRLCQRANRLNEDRERRKTCKPSDHVPYCPIASGIERRVNVIAEHLGDHSSGKYPCQGEFVSPRFDHVTQSARLWIDGQQMSSGYRGRHQFLEGRGLTFGTAIYENAQRGSFVFRTVRFEAD